MDREVPQPAGRQYRGVWMRRWGSWVAEVRMPNSRSRIWLGSFPSAEEAARAFDAAAFCLRGRAAKFNFPDDPPNLPDAENLTSVEIKEAARRFACSRKEANQLVPSVDASMTTKQTEKTTAPMPVPVCTPEPVEGSSSLGILGEPLEEFPPEIYWMHGEVGLCDHDDGSSGSLSPLWNFEAYLNPYEDHP